MLERIAVGREIKFDNDDNKKKKNKNITKRQHPRNRFQLKVLKRNFDKVINSFGQIGIKRFELSKYKIDLIRFFVLQRSEL